MVGKSGTGSQRTALYGSQANRRTMPESGDSRRDSLPISRGSRKTGSSRGASPIAERSRKDGSRIIGNGNRSQRFRFGEARRDTCALDRAGLKPITTVDLEVSTKPWEQVFEGIAKVVAGPRDPEHPPALENSSLDATESENADEIVGEIDDDEIDDDLDISTKPWESVFEGISKIVSGPRDPANPAALADESESPAIESGESDEILGEFDDDEIDDDLPRFQPQRESGSDQIVDVEIVNPDGYTDAIMRDDGSGPPHTRARCFVSQRAVQPRLWSSRDERAGGFWADEHHRGERSGCGNARSRGSKTARDETALRSAGTQPAGVDALTCEDTSTGQRSTYPLPIRAIGIGLGRQRQQPVPGQPRIPVSNSLRGQVQRIVFDAAHDDFPVVSGEMKRERGRKPRTLSLAADLGRPARCVRRFRQHQVFGTVGHVSARRQRDRRRCRIVGHVEQRSDIIADGLAQVGRTSNPVA